MITISYLMWNCEHGDVKPEVNLEKGEMTCATCKEVVRQWVTKVDHNKISLDEFPELAKLGFSGKVQLMAFATHVQKYERNRMKSAFKKIDKRMLTEHRVMRALRELEDTL